MLTILVVEDNRNIRQPLARLLRMQGFETFCAEDGQKGLEALEFLKPDLILLDLLMPVMGGLEFLKILRHNPLWTTMPVVVVTAQPADDESVQAARELGANEILLKATYTPEQLFTSIQRNLAA